MWLFVDYQCLGYSWAYFIGRSILTSAVSGRDNGLYPFFEQYLLSFINRMETTKGLSLIAGLYLTFDFGICGFR
jgi:hypothetical protein